MGSRIWIFKLIFLRIIDLRASFFVERRVSASAFRSRDVSSLTFFRSRDAASRFNLFFISNIIFQRDNSGFRFIFLVQN